MMVDNLNKPPLKTPGQTSTACAGWRNFAGFSWVLSIEEDRVVLFCRPQNNEGARTV